MPSGVFIKKTWFFMFFALLPPTLLVCPRVNFLAPVNSSESQLFSRCLSEPVGMWTLSTYWERSITIENKILESNWAPNYKRGLYSSNVIGRPRCLSTALNRFVPRSQLSFSSFFHENRNHFLTQKNLYEVYGRELDWVSQCLSKSLLTP